MIIVTNQKSFRAKTGADGVSFVVEYREADGQLNLRVNGCRVIAGYLYGPARAIPGGRFANQAEFHGNLKDAVIRALHESGWPRDFPKVQFPALDGASDAAK